MSSNMKNTTLFANTGPLCTITTNLIPDADTDIATGRVVVRPVTAQPPTLGGSLLSQSTPMHAMQTSARKLVWKSDATHRLGVSHLRPSSFSLMRRMSLPSPIELYQRLDDHTQPQCIAYLQPASPSHPLTLFLDPTAEPFRDEILVICLILEQCLHIAERNINVGGGKFEQNKTVFGLYVYTRPVRGWTW
ncbi:hypothetical protein J3R83DRAFT_1438 [Lanmaoa asiatica]|nr:hypothetical protein J3R83DRAFT_1438 [Lanmaoa asiatica]